MSIYDDFLAWDRVMWTRIAIAVPEIAWEEDYVEYAVRQGWLGQPEADEWKRRIRAAKKTAKLSRAVYEGNGVLGRIMELMPEIMSVRTIDWLRAFKVNGKPLIDNTTGNVLRAMISGGKQLSPIFVSDSTLLARAEALFGALTTSHILNTIRDLDDAQIATIRRRMLISLGRDPWNGRLDSENAAIIRQLIEVSVRRTQIARSVVSTGRVLQGTWKEVAAQRDVWSALSIIFDDLFANENADKILRNAVRAGVIPQDKYELIRAFGKAGVNLWKKGVHASEYDSWVARTLIVGEGVLSSESLNLLVRLGIIHPDAALALRPLMHLSRVVLRANLENYMVNTRFRVRPGESAIQTYRRLTTRTDGELLRLLAAAAKDTEATIAAEMNKPGFGKKIQTAQQRQILTAIHGGMKNMWENVGSLTIFGEKQAAQAALEATEFMMEAAYANSGRSAVELQRSLRYQARAGIDAFISRDENLLQLSRRVYKNVNLTMGQVQLEVKKGLIRQLSARDLAKNVADMIRPDVQGGVSYAAMRLARTEINNAFHFSQIRYTREMPWVEGYKWNKSKSHGHVDVCDERAQKNHEGLGRGVYSKKNVPGKAHPQCLCFLTTVLADSGTFEKRLRSGAYDKYLNQAERGNFGEGFEVPSTVREAGVDFVRDGGKILAQSAGLAFANAAEQAVRDRLQ
ncbi:MuF-like minor capsid protein [Arthrobacter phage Wollypog]|uniref:MuF-like minor capsid protein n=1 Tax=Arthrobacter phage Wollypog TaxID=2790985 RepID=A0A7T3KC64_9CAUD|nr:minor head protein [Arthrobacter phage Wollypog]QPX62556.1 MuF-like minor capsid protein [Arthrobacter phage Wollypog]